MSAYPSGFKTSPLCSKMESSHSRPVGPQDSRRRVHHTFCFSSSPSQDPPKSNSGTRGTSGSGALTYTERCGGKGYSSEFSGVLQSSLPSSEEKRLLETCHRPVHPKSICGRSDFQNGNVGIYPEFHSTWPLGSFPGSGGCVLPRSDSPTVQEVPSFLFPKRGTTISVSPLRSGYSPSAIHQTYGHCSGVLASKRLDPSSVFRRLASSPVKPYNPFTGSEELLVGTNPPGSSIKPREVRVDTLSKLHLRGNEFPHRSGYSSSPFSSGGSFNRSGEDLCVTSQGSCQILPSTIGRSQCSGRLYTSGQTAFAPPSVLSDDTLEIRPRPFVSLGSHPTYDSAPSSMVDSRGKILERGTIVPPFSYSVSIYGCEPFGLGGSLRAPRTTDPGCVVHAGISHPYKQSGAQGSSPGLIQLQRDSQGSVYHALDRQHYSGVLYTEAGGNSLPFTLPRNQTSFQRMLVHGGQSPGKISPRTSQCPSGWTLQEESNTSCGMDSPTGGCKLPFSGARYSDGGLICHSSQPSSTTVCFTSSGSSSLGSRCSVPQLEPHIRLCVPSLHPHSSVSEENQGVKVPSHSDSPLVAPEILVQRSSGPTLGSSSLSTAATRSSLSKRSGNSSRPKHSPPSRLAFIRHSLRKKRFSSKAAEFVSKARRDSTTAVYNAKWKIFTDWCSRKKVDPVYPSLRRIADFFIFLFEKKNLSVSTIRGYRSMLSQTLSFRKTCTIGTDPILSDLIRSFELKRPVCRSLAPKWNLSCVLWSLTKTPYEPLSEASIKFLSWKTVFLLTLASAKRRSEIHALSVEEGHLRFNSVDDSVSLLCQTGFLAKTQLPSVAPSPFVIPSLSHSCGGEDTDRLLCPVRALKFYLNRVKNSRGNRKRLFIPLKGKGDISATSISRWIACTIKNAYSNLSEVDISHLNIRPHELRALSTSWAFINNTPLEDILRAAVWRNQSTFSSFYLRSFSSQTRDLYSLGPLVASQTIVSAPSASPPSLI